MRQAARFRSRGFLFGLLLSLTAAVGSQPAGAVPVAAFDPSTDAFNVNLSDAYTLGMRFTATSTFDVLALGAWDETIASGSGLHHAHQIGLWSFDDQALLGYVDLPAGSPGYAIDDYRYVDISPVTLMAREDYVIAIHYLDDMPNYSLANVPALIDPRIGFVATAYLTISPGLQFPTNSAPDYWFGANMLIDDHVESAEVPEPATLAIFAAGLPVVAFLRRRGRETRPC